MKMVKSDDHDRRVDLYSRLKELVSTLELFVFDFDGLDTVDNGHQACS